MLLRPAVPWAWQWLLSEGQCSIFSSGELRAETALNHYLNTFCGCLPVSCFLVTKMMILHWGLLESQKIKDCNSIFLPLPQKVIQPLKCWKRLRGHYLSLGAPKGQRQLTQRIMWNPAQGTRAHQFVFQSILMQFRASVQTSNRGK